MYELENDIEYILDSVKNGKKIALCCILFNDNKNKNCERLYHLSHTMPASYVLGEIELWKMDIQENMVLDQNEINKYTRTGGEIDE